MKKSIQILLQHAKDIPTAKRALHEIGSRGSDRGFSRTDLLVVVAVLAVLLGLFVRERARAAVGSPASVCQENLRRLSIAWYLYASDHEGRLVPNLSIPETEATISSKRFLNWANNVMSWDTRPLITNLQLTASSKLFPYLPNDPDVFRCPNDTYLSAMQLKAGWTRRARSYSMNDCLGSPFERPSQVGNTASGVNEWCPQQRHFLSLAAIPQPSGIYAFLEEHPDSINDGVFIPGCAGTGWMDEPASFHNGACSFAFADGHAELHPWVHESTKLPVRFFYSQIPVPSTTRDDYQWVLDRRTVQLSQLSVRKGTSNDLQIIWAQLPTNYVMQESGQLSSGAWTNAGSVLERCFGQNAIRVPIEGSQRFFRLAR